MPNASLCAGAGLALQEDAIGNIFARWRGSEPELVSIGTGSHIDAIPNAGSYDGTIGVLGGLEAIRSLQRAGFRPRRSIELVIFTAEEPTRFGIGCPGSRMMAGILTPKQAVALHDNEGYGLEEWRVRAGITGPLESIALPAKRSYCPEHAGSWREEANCIEADVLTHRGPYAHPNHSKRWQSDDP